MELYLGRDGERVGPYSEEQVVSMVASGEIRRDDVVWHEGLAGWQPVGSVLDLGVPVQPMSPPSPAGAPSGDPGAGMRRGAMVGGWICLGLGLLCMVGSLFLFFLYGPLFLVAFVLSIVVMSQRGVSAGVVLLVATIVVPSLLAIVLVTTRVVNFAETVTESIEEMVREADQKALEELRERSVRHERRMAALARFSVLEASFSREESESGVRETVVVLKIRNGTEFPVRRARFHGVLSSPGRSIPWIDGPFEHEVAGGVEPGETQAWSLGPDRLGGWGDVDAPPDAEFTVSVVRLDGADGLELFGGVEFSEEDRERLRDLEVKYEGPRPEVEEEEGPGR